MASCFLAPYSSKPCDGRLVRAHLIRQQVIRNLYPHGAAITLGDHYEPAPRVKDWPEEAGIYMGRIPLREILRDTRSWVWACGGPTGVAGHHGELDHGRTLRVPREGLPGALEEYVREYPLLAYWLDREYGLRRVPDEA